MTVGEMKEAIKDLPDDYEVVIDGADVEDCEIAELHLDSLYTPHLDHTGLVVLSAGQPISEDYDYHVRLDVALDYDKGVRWDEENKRWR